MSSVRLRAVELSRELEAAILGDFPRLERGSQDAQRFARAFGPQAGDPWWERERAVGHLGRAAEAVGNERRGETEEALEIYRSLARSRLPWVKLLGLLLQSWSGAVVETKPIHRAAGRVSELRASARKARLLAKLSGLAADKGEREFARALWRQAIEATDPGTHLGRALRIEGINLNLPVSDVRFARPAHELSDPLVWPEQIETLRLTSANEAMVQDVEDRIGGAWQETIRMGSGPLASIDSAEVQARWIGLPWERRPIQKQLGAQLLGGGAEGAGQWAHGVLAWTLGSGSHYDKALRYAEPHFDHDAGDRILATVADCDPTRGRDLRLASLAAEAWDLLSDGLLRRLVDEVPPQLGPASPASESRVLWAAFAIRLPEEWFERYRNLEPELQAALLDSLEPSATRHFNREMKATMYAALGDDEDLLADGGQLLPFAATLAPRREWNRLRRLVEEERPKFARVISRLIEERSEIVSPDAEARTLRALHESVREQSEEARHGTTMMGGAGPRIELGRMLSLCKKPERSAIQLLVETAIDPTLPPQYRMEARQGLVLVRRAGRLRTGDLRRLRAAPQPAAVPVVAEGASPGVLRAFLLLVLAEHTTSGERAELVSLVRSPEERVRILAASACAEALTHSTDEGLGWAIVSALFDPSPAVCEAALAGLPALDQGFRPAAEVAWQRLPALFAASARSVRVEIVRVVTVTKIRRRAQRQQQRELLVRARNDRSWRVRTAAAELGERSRG
jgi:hypothetical protein